MHVILLADRLGQEVAPIDRRYSPALLPIAGRSVLERNLDLLVGRGVTHISLIIARDPEWFRARIADGSRWGIDLDILPMPGERDPREQIKRLGAMAALPAPVLRADVLLMPEWFKDDSLTISEQAMASGAPVCHPASVADPSLARLHWPELRDNAQLGPALLASLSHYHALVMQALDADDSGLTPHGERGVLPGEQDLHHVYYAAGATRLDESRLTGGFAGITTHVEPGVLLKGHCCLEQGSYVEEGAMLEDCVILPFTRVHGGQQVNAGILFEGEALDRTAPHWLKDRRQAGAASQRGVAYRNPARPEWQERILAALIALQGASPSPAPGAGQSHAAFRGTARALSTATGQGRHQQCRRHPAPGLARHTGCLRRDAGGHPGRPDAGATRRASRSLATAPARQAAVIAPVRASP